MDKMIYTMLNGMKIMETQQINNANEMANLNTPGFKTGFKLVTGFKNVTLPGSMSTRATPVPSKDTKVDMTPGSVMPTGRNLDIYVESGGLIGVESSDGKEVYTRRGDLMISESGFLKTGGGALVLGDGGPIKIPKASKVEIFSDGKVMVHPLGAKGHDLQSIGRIRLVAHNNMPLRIREDGLYETENGEKLPTDATINLIPRSLEGSNSNVVDLLAKMIRDSRTYEMHVQVVKQAKEADSSSASVMKMN